jgi:hypothetical protein
VGTIPAQADGDERAEDHANEAERLLKSRFISSHVKAQVHATLALYYSARQSGPEGRPGATSASGEAE